MSGVWPIFHETSQSKKSSANTQPGKAFYLPRMRAQIQKITRSQTYLLRRATVLILGHHKLHTGERPYTCPGCNRSFARMDALNRFVGMTCCLILVTVSPAVNVLYTTCQRLQLSPNKMLWIDGCPSLLVSGDQRPLKGLRHHYPSHQM